MLSRVFESTRLAVVVCAAFTPITTTAQDVQSDEKSIQNLFSPQALKDIFGDQAANFSFAELQDASEVGDRNYDIYINDRFTIHQKVKIVRKENGILGIMIPAQVILAQDLRFADLPELSKKQPMDMIENLPELITGSNVEFDTLAGTVHISIPENWFKNFGLHSDIVPPQRWTYGIPAAVLNYRANVDWQRLDGFNSKHGYLDLDGQLNFGRWRVFANGSFSYNDTDTEQTRDFEHGTIFATRVFGESKTRVRFGEIYTQSFYLDSIPLQGIEFYDDETMLSSVDRSYTPVVSGIALSPARVTVRQLGRTVFERNVPAGPFSFDDLPGLTSNINLEVTITEQNGQERSFLVPYTSTPLLLRSGRTHFNAAVGRYHDRNAENSDSPFVFIGGIGYGLPFDASIFSGMQISEKYQGLTAGIAANLGYVGALSLQFDHSSYNIEHDNFDDNQGLRARLQWNKNFDETNSYISASWRRYLTGRYLSMTDALSWHSRNYDYTFDSPNNFDDALRDDVSISLTQPLGRFGSIGLSGSLYRYADSRSTQNLSASYTSNWKGITATISLQHRVNEGNYAQKDKETVCYVNISIPLSIFGGYNFSRHSLNLGMTRSDDGTLSTTEGISGSFGEFSRWSYSLSASQYEDGKSYYASLSKEAEFGRFTLSASSSDSVDSYTGSLDGSLVATADGLFPARTLSGSSVLIEVPNAPDARPDQFTVSSRVGSKVLVTGLDDYRSNDIAIEPNTIPANVVMPIYIKRLVPADNAILSVTFETMRGLQFVPEILREDGSRLPFGTFVRIIGPDLLSGMDTVVNERSRAYFASAPIQGHVEAVWEEQGEKKTCWAAYNLSDVADKTPDDKIVRRTLTCRPVSTQFQTRGHQ